MPNRGCNWIGPHVVLETPPEIRGHDHGAAWGGVLLGGRVVVGDRANLGLGTVVHQRRVVGPDVMVGMGSVVTRDVPPCAKAFGTSRGCKG